MRKIRTSQMCNQGSRVTGVVAPLDNGKLPHGGYKGSKRHPLSILSFNKGLEFQQNIAQRLEHILLEETIPTSAAPTWAILLHRAPSYSDESPLLANNLLKVSKLQHSSDTNSICQNSLETRMQHKPIRDTRRLYYRPNSTHQFLSSTDLRKLAGNEDDVKYGRPTRTTLLRTLQRRTCTSAHSYDTQRDFLHLNFHVGLHTTQLLTYMVYNYEEAPVNHTVEACLISLTRRMKSRFLQDLHDLRISSYVTLPYQCIKSEKLQAVEAMHSFITGARYNRYNPELGCWFTGIKGQESTTLETQLQAKPLAKQRPVANSAHWHRPATSPNSPATTIRSRDRKEKGTCSQATPLKLKVIGNTLSASKPTGDRLQLPQLQGQTSLPENQCNFPKNTTCRTFNGSPRSHSAKDDSDIQDISDSVRNAIIAAGEEKPSSGFSGNVKIIETEVVGLEEQEGGVQEDTQTGRLHVGLSSLSMLSLQSSTQSSPCQNKTKDKNDERSDERIKHNVRADVTGDRAGSSDNKSNDTFDDSYHIRDNDNISTVLGLFDDEDNSGNVNDTSQLGCISTGSRDTGEAISAKGDNSQDIKDGYGKGIEDGHGYKIEVGQEEEIEGGQEEEIEGSQKEEIEGGHEQETEDEHDQEKKSEHEQETESDHEQK